MNNIIYFLIFVHVFYYFFIFLITFKKYCSCFCLFAHRGICYGIACGGVLFLAIFVAVFGFPVWVAELFEKRMEARRKNRVVNAGR